MVIKWVDGLVSPSKYGKHLAKSWCLAIVRRMGDRGPELLGYERSLSLVYIWNPPHPHLLWLIPRALGTVWGRGTKHGRVSSSLI